ncbi:TPA: hypothetical protein ENX78_18245 [Candidatus Poribacteria bacterium]|nr:hypothetical protein [Candidatus Poribacteria bacterium]
MTKMSINDILDLIEKLKDKINKYRNDFSANEFLVRYSLIDPFLRALGWDTEDPDQVRPEYSTGAGRPDYALFLKGKESPIAFVGAKKLGKFEDLDQYLTYCLKENVKFFIATEGDHWELYDVFKQEKIKNKRVVEWNISKGEPSEILFKSLLIANSESFGKIPRGFVVTSNYEQSMTERPNYEIPPSNPENIQTEKENVSKRKASKPLSITINGETIQISKQKEILVQTAEWLIRKGVLTNSTTPIGEGNKRWLINSTPVHKDGSNFVAKEKLSNGLYIETKNPLSQTEKEARYLLKHFGYNENLISVKYNE